MPLFLALVSVVATFAALTPTPAHATGASPASGGAGSLAKGGSPLKRVRGVVSSLSSQALPAGEVPTPSSITVFRGSLYVASWSTGTVFRLPILQGGLLGAPVPYVTGLRNPLGIAFDPGTGTLFVSDSHPSSRGDRTTDGCVWAFSGPEATPQLVIDGLPNGRHNTNGLAVRRGRLYITNGNSTDDGVEGGEPEEPLSGTLLSVPLTARGLQVGPPSAPLPAGLVVEATGMRNIYDVAFRPGTDEAWMPMNGNDTQDPWGEDLLLKAHVDDPDVTPDFGFPGCVYASNPVRVSQNLNPAVSDICDGTQTPPEALLGMHVSANGLAFGPGGDWGHDVYIAEFGSIPGKGSAPGQLVRVPLDRKGRVSGAPITLLSGLNVLDVAFGHDGLYVADFITGALLLLRKP